MLTVGVRYGAHTPQIPPRRRRATYRDRLAYDLTRQNVAVKVQEDLKDLGGDTLAKLDA